MSAHTALYLATRATLQSAQEAFRISRANLRKFDPESFRLITAGETSTKGFRTPAKRSEAWHSRREAIERGVIKNWTLSTPSDHDANWEECCRIGEILKDAGLFAQGSHAAGSVRNYALQNSLMLARPGLSFEAIA